MVRYEASSWTSDNDQVYGVAWSPDGTQLAIAGGNYPTKVWDMDNGQEALTLRGDNGDVLSLAWSPDSKRLVAGSYGTAKVWDAASGQEVLTLSSYSIVAWSSDGKRLATTDGHWVKVWDASSGQESATLDPRHDGYHVNDVSLSSDGKRLAIAGENATAEVWDVISGQLVVTLRGHANSVDGVAFSPEGKRLAMWREIYGRGINNVDIEPIGDEPFHADVTFNMLPGVGIASGLAIARALPGHARSRQARFRRHHSERIAERLRDDVSIWQRA